MRFVQRFLFISFRRFKSLEYRFSRRFSKGGKMVFLGLACSAVLGADTNPTLIYQLFAFLVVLLLLSALFIPLFSGHFSISRRLPRFVTAGQPFEYEITVQNLTDKTYNDLLLLEDLADPRPDFATFLTAREPGGEGRNWFDRKMAYHRFNWLCQLQSGLKLEEVEINTIGPHSGINLRIKAKPLRRGVFHLLGATLAREDPLGLIRSYSKVSATENFLVVPKRYSLPPDFKINGGRRYQVGGEGQKSGVGDSEEFVSLRDYREGDSPRRIHWPSLAKSGKLAVKEYQEEYFTRHGLILDTHAEVGENLFEDAVSLAASVALDSQTNSLLLDMMFVSRQAFCLTIGRGMGQASQALEALASVQPAPKTPFADLSRLVLSHAHKLSGLLLILLHWDDARQEFLRQLQAHSIQVTVWVLVAPNRTFTQLEGKTHVGDARIRLLRGEDMVKLGKRVS